jgi:hypothetical protein
MLKIAVVDNVMVFGVVIGSLHAGQKYRAFVDDDEHKRQRKYSHFFTPSHESSDRHDLGTIFIATLQCNDRIPDIRARHQRPMLLRPLGQQRKDEHRYGPTLQ